MLILKLLFFWWDYELEEGLMLGVISGTISSPSV